MFKDVLYQIMQLGLCEFFQLHMYTSAPSIYDQETDNEDAASLNYNSILYKRSL
jgi:hypothetical protein